MAISAASETRLLLPPVTLTTGVWPRRPQVRPFGGLRPWPDSSSKQSQAPRSAAVLTGNRSAATGRAAADPDRRRPSGLGLGVIGQAAGAMVTVRPSAWTVR